MVFKWMLLNKEMKSRSKARGSLAFSGSQRRRKGRDKKYQQAGCLFLLRCSSKCSSAYHKSLLFKAASSRAGQPILVESDMLQGQGTKKKSAEIGD